MTQLIPAWEGGRLVPVEKLDVHRRGLRHKAVSVFVLRGREVLLQRRALNKYHTPGLWANTCCTHPLWDEPSAACARRRLREELGMENLVPVPRVVVEYRAEVGGGLVEHEVVELFTAKATPDLKVAPNPHEVMAVRWVDLAALQDEVRDRPGDYVPWLRIYLARHHDALFGSLLGA